MAVHVFGPLTRVYLAGDSLTNSVRAVALNYEAEALDGTATIDTTRTMVAGLKNWTLAIDGLYSPDAREQALFNRVGGSQGLVTVWPEVTAGGDVAYFGSASGASLTELGAVGELAPYSLALVAKNAAGEHALIRGIIARNSSTITATGVSSAYELGAVPAGSRCYLGAHVTAVDGGTAPTVQFSIESDDNAGFTSATSHVSSAVISGTGAAYIYTSGAVTDTYWRAAWTITGSPTAVALRVSMGIL